MQVRAQKRLLMLGVVALLAGSVAAVAWPLLDRPVTVPSKSTVDAGKMETKTESEALPTVEDFSPVWDKPLQRPLIDPVIVIEKTEPKVKAAPPPPPRPGWKLVGVYYSEASPESSMATLMLGNTRKYVNIGDTIQGGTISRIEVSRVTVEMNDREYVFELNE